MLRSVGIAWCLMVGTALANQNVIVVFDDSGSMASHMRSDRKVRKIAAAREALTVVLNKLPPDARVGVVALNAGWIVPLQAVDPSQMRSLITKITANGGTPLGQYLKVAAEALLKDRDERLYGDYRLLILSDGEASDQPLVDAILPDLMTRGIMVDVIGVDMEADHSLATRVHAYRRADDPEALKRAIAEALAEADAYAVGGESDFELLEGFPIDVASLAIDTLSATNNEPLRLGSNINVVPSQQPGISPIPQGQAEKDGGSRVSKILFSLAIFFVITKVMSRRR